MLWIPGDGGHEIDAMTSHVDIAPTPLPLLGVRNPAEDYSLGRDLRGPIDRRFMVVSDWSRIGIVDPRYKLTLPIHGAGLLLGNALTTRDDAPLPDAGRAYRAAQPELREAIEELHRFRREPGATGPGSLGSGGCGLGVALGPSLGLLFAFEAGAGIGADYLPLAALALALLLIGFADDVFYIPARLKFLLFAAVAIGGAASGGVVTALPLAPGEALALPYALGLLGTALWIFTLVNAVNFMDGANGVAMGSMAIGLGGVAAIALAEGLPAIAVANLCCMGALVGVLVWNFPHGRLFAGDAGALFGGAVGAFGSLVLIARAGVSPFVPPLGPAQSVPGLPYDGRRSRTCVGAAGELIELIEAG